MAKKTKHPQSILAYDGIVGDLPDWIPEELALDFRIFSREILKVFSRKQILEFLAQLDHRQDVIPASPEGCEGFFEDELERLAYIKHVVLLGPREGLKYHLGEVSLKKYDEQLVSHRARDAAKKPRQDRLQKLIVEMVKEKRDITWTEVRDKLKRSIGNGVVSDMDEDSKIIGWYTTDKQDQSRESPISGLKDRVSHAKKALDSL